MYEETWLNLFHVSQIISHTKKPCDWWAAFFIVENEYFTINFVRKNGFCMK